MNQGFDSEHREFVRIKAEIPIRYKFLSRVIELQEEGVCEGTTSNIGGGGFLLVGRIPEPNWYADLLLQRIVIGVNIYLPPNNEPIKALCRCAWIEALDEPRRVGMGLLFKEISRQGQDEIFRFVIKAQLR